MTAKAKLLRNGFISSLSFSAVLFISAGRIDYLQGWIYFLTTLMTTSLDIITAQNNPELIAERSKPGEGSMVWDKKILGISAVIFFSTIVVAGLDSGRHGWSPQYPLITTIVGVVLVITGQAVFLVARNENKFFSTVVRIQKERGHKVCDTGVYKMVRHPGYLGMIISTSGLPLLFGSKWSVIPTVCAIILLCIRTVLEDTTLTTELPGYSEYTRTTHFKLIPFVW